MFIGIFFILGGIAKSQTYRFIYELQYKNDSASSIFQKENMVLDITEDDVKFYDYSFLRYDSINKKKGENWQTNSLTDQLNIRKRGTSNNIAFKSINFNYFKIKTTDEIEWNIEQETQVLSGYHLQKATCSFGGRDWVAWFSRSFPFHEGPFKFCGLPGLIFQIQDTKNYFKYTLLKSSTLTHEYDTSDFLETHYGSVPVEIGNEKYKKLLLDLYNDPVAEMRNSLKNGGIVTINNQSVKSLQDLDNQRKFIQENIRKNYNPIEINEAVDYK